MRWDDELSKRDQGNGRHASSLLRGDTTAPRQRELATSDGRAFLRSLRRNVCCDGAGPRRQTRDDKREREERVELITSRCCGWWCRAS